MKTELSSLRRQAGAFLNDSELAAWEPQHRRRTLDALDHFAAGRLTVSEVRASIGVPETRVSRPAPSVALLSLTGILIAGDNILSWLGLATNLRGFRDKLAAAAADPAITAIVVVVDSPGGSIRLVPETAYLLHATRASKPIVVSVAGLCASAAYWISANATRIEATPSADIGAIGIVCQRASIHRRLAEEGIDIATISAGKFKAEGLPETPMSDAERQHLQKRVDVAYTQFVGDVARGRGMTAAAVRAGYGEGRCLDAPEAQRAGMIDGLATVEQTIVSTLARPQALQRTMVAQRAARTIPAAPPRAFPMAWVAAHRRTLAVAARRGTT